MAKVGDATHLCCAFIESRSGTEADRTFVFDMPVRQENEPGVYLLTLRFEDPAGHKVTLTADQLRARGLPDRVTVR